MEYPEFGKPCPKCGEATIGWVFRFEGYETGVIVLGLVLCLITAGAAVPVVIVAWGVFVLYGVLANRWACHRCDWHGDALPQADTEVHRPKKRDPSTGASPATRLGKSRRTASSNSAEASEHQARTTDSIRTKVIEVDGANPDGTSRQTLIRALAVGESVFLIRPPDGPPGDMKLLVAAETGDTLGRLPAKVAKKLSRRWPIGREQLPATVNRITGGRKGRPVGFTIAIEEGELEAASVEIDTAPGLAQATEPPPDIVNPAEHPPELVERLFGIEPDWALQRKRRALMQAFQKWNARMSTAISSEDRAEIQRMLDLMATLGRYYE